MSPAFIVIDFESFYDQQYSLRKMTPVEYILDPRFECMGASITEGNDGVPFWLDADQLPAYLESKRGLPIPFISHNALFDMCLLAWRFGFVPHLMVDTMAMARAMVFAYTGSVSLEAVAAYLGLGVKTKTILKVAGMSPAAIKAAGLWQEYIDYACNDGALCRDIFKVLRVDFPRSEYEVVDHVIRAAAIPRFVLNRDKLALHAHQIEQNKATLLARTGLPDRDALMSNDKFATALEMLGVTPPLKISPTTGEETYAFAKTDAGMIELEEHENPDVQALVAARLGFKSTIEQTRTARFQAIANLTWPGKEPLPWMPIPLRYSGAHTHRFSGDWKLNMQNLGRTSVLREALEAMPGHKVVVVDASQIEARFNPYFAGQDDLVEAFRLGHDIYSQFAGEEIYRRPVNKKEHPTERFVGKQCLAAGTLVLTNRGPVAIEKVTTDHKVWDGQEWVCHKGLVQQGWKQTVKLSGVSLTPDHLVLCGTQWLEAQYLVSDAKTRSLALATAAAELSSLVTSRVNAAGSLPSLSSATAVGPSTLSPTIISKRSNQPGATIAPNWLARVNGTGATVKQCLMTATGHDFSTGSPLRSVGAMPQQTGTTAITAGAGSLSGLSGAQTGLRFSGMFSRFRAGMTQRSKWTGLMSTPATSPATSALSPKAKTPETSDKSQISKLRLPVYDLLSAGPRHRFTILTNDGPLIVHNCILGLGYQMGAPKFQNTVRVQSRLQLGQELIIPLVDAGNIVQAYRRRFSKIVDGWKTMQNALPALASHDSGFEYGPFKFRHQKIVGPNGLCLFYHGLNHELFKGQWQWRFKYGREWKSLYGGKLVENLVQFAARIHTMEAASRASRRFHNYGLTFVNQVHDELVFVVPDAVVSEFLQCLIEELSSAPNWAPGIPLAAEGNFGLSYAEAK